MRRVYFWWMTCGLAVACSAGAVLWAQSPNAGDASRQEARSIFEGVCAGCHGLDGRGEERGPDVASRRDVVGKSDADLFSVIKDGRPSRGMPAFGAYGEKQLLSLVAYLRELQGSGKQTSSSGEPARGRELFFGNGRCSECHMVAGRGGFFAGELTGFAAKRSADEVRSAIVAPEKDRDPRKGPVTLKLENGKVLTGMPRNEDNFSLQLQTFDGLFHLLKKSEIISRQPAIAISADHGRALSSNELNDLVGFLVRSAASEDAARPADNPDDGDEE